MLDRHPHDTFLFNVTAMRSILVRSSMPSNPIDDFHKAAEGAGQEFLRAGQYTIRSIPAHAHNSMYCAQLARNAVHAGMAGKTNMVVGARNDEFVYIPIDLVVGGRKHVDLKGKLWSSVLEATGQPSFKPEC